MKLHADTPGSALHRSSDIPQVKSLRITTELDNYGDFVEVQVAEMRDGSLNIIVAGEIHVDTDQRGNPRIQVWPTRKAPQKLSSNERWARNG